MVGTSDQHSPSVARLALYLERFHVVLLGCPEERRLVVLVDVVEARAFLQQRADSGRVAVTRCDQQRTEVVLVAAVDARTSAIRMVTNETNNFVSGCSSFPVMPMN